MKKNFVLVEKKGKVTLHLSKIFKWFGDDFGKDKDDRMAFISKYVSPTDAAVLKNAAKVNIEFLEYNWLLNEIL